MSSTAPVNVSAAPVRVNLTYGQAIREALRRCLSEIPETLLYGEDVAKPGGVFGVTRGLHREFAERVFDTPSASRRFSALRWVPQCSVGAQS
jgi:acetoin:2,6-dichlorophenolindophenol oxidoreductase subunit beta